MKGNHFHWHLAGPHFRDYHEDDDDEFVPASEMIRRLLGDNGRMAEAQRAAIEVCEDHGDTPTANILQDILDQTERRIWFLYEISQAHE